MSGKTYAGRTFRLSGVLIAPGRSLLEVSNGLVHWACWSR